MKIIVTGAKGTLSKKVSDHLRKNHLVKQISLRGNVEEVDIEEHTDCVVHIAGVTPSNITSEDDYELVNVQKTAALYKTCQARGVKHFIYISSMSVYEGYFKRLFHKGIGKSTPCSPKTPYARSKHRAEQTIIKEYDGRMSYTIIRVPSLYDSLKKEYFSSFVTFASRMPIVFMSPFKIKKSLLHTDNLCALIQRHVEKAILCNEIVLPQDGKIANVNMLLSKIVAENGIKKRKSYLAGLLLFFVSLVLPRFRGLFQSVYYVEKDSELCLDVSLDDVKI